jgi:PAS domain S-box-containing protein
MTGEKEERSCGMRRSARRESPVRVQVATIPDAAFVIDRDGRIEDLNAVAAALVGYDREELCGRPIERVLVAVEVTHADDTSCDGVRFIAASAGAHALHRNGRAIAVEALLCPDVQGATVAVVRALDDARDRLREDDVAQIVHDLKSPLATIALETAMLDDRIADLDHTGLQRAIDRITNNVDFLDRMVHDLLDLCALDSGHFALHRSSTDLAMLVEHVVDRAVASRDRHRVRIEAAPGAMLSIDQHRIERVIANLVQNAIKYTPREGRIVVKLEVSRDHASVSVVDEGPGIDANEMATLFEKYRRASNGNAQCGSGLGLFVSKQIVEAHGGRIGVDSARGRGSRFFFELPLA